MTHFMSLDEIVDDLLLYRFDEQIKQLIRKVSLDELLTMTKLLRSSFNQDYDLWNPANPHTLLDYQPMIVDGVDVNPKHPENFAAQILRVLWKRLR